MSDRPNQRDAYASKKNTCCANKNQHRISPTLNLFPYSNAALAESLTNGELEDEERQAEEEEGDAVGDEEGSAAVLLCEVGEPPHVPQPHRVPDGCQDEGQLGGKP